MEQLRNKSEISIASAELLHNRSMYPSVIHYAYYSCIQMIIYVLRVKFNHSENDLKPDNGEKVGAHEKLINTVSLYFQKNGYQQMKKFVSEINDLKRLRIDADYKDISIDYDKSSSSIKLSKSIVKDIKNLK
jgi:uncharacterized protein (UPF0332 family)